jgi:sugar lactone lactonase YvrE
MRPSHFSSHRAKPAILRVALIAALLANPPAGYGDIMYVSNYGYGQVVRFDTVTGANLGVVADTVTGGPMGLTFDSGGNLYTANVVNRMIEKFTPDGAGAMLVNKAGSYWFPYALVTDSANNLYVGNAANDSIEKITPAGVVSTFAYTGLHSGPSGLAFDSRGNLFVAVTGYNTILKLTPNGAASLFATANGPLGLAFDSAGTLYVSESNTIERFTPNGVGSFFASNQDGALGLAFDSADNLYAANFHATTIEKFTPDGSRSVFASASLTEPAFMVIVPEPGFLSLLAVGAAVLALRARRPGWTLARWPPHQRPIKHQRRLGQAPPCRGFRVAYARFSALVHLSARALACWSISANRSGWHSFTRFR